MTRDQARNNLILIGAIVIFAPFFFLLFLSLILQAPLPIPTLPPLGPTVRWLGAGASLTTLVVVLAGVVLPWARRQPWAQPLTPDAKLEARAEEAEQRAAEAERQSVTLRAYYEAQLQEATAKLQSLEVAERGVVPQHRHEARVSEAHETGRLEALEEMQARLGTREIGEVEALLQAAAEAREYQRRTEAALGEVFGTSDLPGVAQLYRSASAAAARHQQQVIGLRQKLGKSAADLARLAELEEELAAARTDQGKPNQREFWLVLGRFMGAVQAHPGDLSLRRALVVLREAGGSIDHNKKDERSAFSALIQRLAVGQGISLPHPTPVPVVEVAPTENDGAQPAAALPEGESGGVVAERPPLNAPLLNAERGTERAAETARAAWEEMATEMEQAREVSHAGV